MKFGELFESSGKWYTLCNGQDIYVVKTFKEFCSNYGIENGVVSDNLTDDTPITIVYNNGKVYSSVLDGLKIPSLKNVKCAVYDDTGAYYVYGKFKLHDVNNDEYFTLKDALKLPKCSTEERLFTVVEDD